MELLENAAGRKVPKIEGTDGWKPYAGTPSSWPQSKVRGSLEEAIKASGLKDGMTISFHHHLRNGDLVIVEVLNKLAGMGFKDLRLAQTAMFKKQVDLIDHIENGVITRIEGSINGPVGAHVTRHPLEKPVVLRSHGGRTRAIAEGELAIDVFFLAASASDRNGNCNGVLGKSAFGPMGFAFVDAWHAKNVIVITDNLVDYPCKPISIPEAHVDHVVVMDSIGDPGGIASGTTKLTTDTERLKIAEQVVDFIELSGLLKDGFSFQAGAGGTSLAAVKFLHDRMKERGVKGSFAVGGVTQLVVDMLRDGTIETIVDAQAFDAAAAESLLNDDGHIEVSHYHLMNQNLPSCVVHNQDVCFLGATEVDVDFNVNVNTHSDGQLLHGIGGHQDAAAGAKICFIVCPLYRKTNPIVRDRVTTITTPGEVVDVIVTEAGIAVNPRRADLLEKVKDSGLPIKTIEELRDMAYEATGGAQPLELTDEIVALIQWRDGTLLDTVWKPKGLE